MDKRVDGLAGALREIAEARDSRLGNAGAIPADRVERLRALVAEEFPVEAVFVAAARERDESLSMAEPALPQAVRSALAAQVRDARAPAKSFGILRPVFPWLETVRSRRAYQTAALLAAGIIITAALYFLPSNKPVVRSVSQSRASFIVDQDPAFLSGNRIFERSDDPLPLRISRLEVASLQSSLLAINRALRDSEQRDRVRLLDVPIRQIRLDVDAVRTP